MQLKVEHEKKTLKIHVRILTIPGPMCVPSIRVWQSTYFVHTNLFFPNLFLFAIVPLLKNPEGQSASQTQEPASQGKGQPVGARVSHSRQVPASQPAGPEGQPPKGQPGSRASRASRARGPAIQPARTEGQPSSWAQGPASKMGPRANYPAEPEGLPARPIQPARPKGQPASQARGPASQTGPKASLPAIPEGQSGSQA